MQRYSGACPADARRPATTRVCAEGAVPATGQADADVKAVRVALNSQMILEAASFPVLRRRTDVPDVKR